MPYPVVPYTIMEDDGLRISVVEVYDLALDIGKEFEKIIDCYGAEAVTGLMPRVICSLEHLEKLATRYETTSTDIEELKATITRLENEKIGKAEDRQRYEKELEEMDDRLREESHELVAMVSRLQGENRKLSSSLAKSAEGTVIYSNGTTPEVDMKIVSHLQEIIERQREQIRKKEKECHNKTSEAENVVSQLEKINREFRRRQRTNASQMRCLIDERAELQAALQEERRASAILRQKLGLAQKENEDLASISVESVDLTNKIVFDKDDTNRPRFTMTELKEILYERNELKARVSDLEDELLMYRPRPTSRQRSYIICPPLEADEESDSSQNPTDSPSSSSTYFSRELLSAVEESDAPAQGPMPYEPEDAPWKKKGESGIRKFFRHLFGEGKTSPGGTPIRGIISLPKT